MKSFQMLLNLLGYGAICLLGGVLVFSYFSLGISFREIVILLGIPLTVGLFTHYAIF